MNFARDFNWNHSATSALFRIPGIGWVWRGGRSRMLGKDSSVSAVQVLDFAKIMNTRRQVQRLSKARRTTLG
jgi:hypothetical protein